MNDVKHTGNGVDNLKQWSGDKYTNEFNYIEAQAVSDKNIVTANGTGCLEFTRELLLLLKADTEEKINEFYDFQKGWFYKIFLQKWFYKIVVRLLLSEIICKRYFCLII